MNWGYAGSMGAMRSPDIQVPLEITAADIRCMEKRFMKSIEKVLHFRWGKNTSRVKFVDCACPALWIKYFQNRCTEGEYCYKDATIIIATQKRLACLLGTNSLIRSTRTGDFALIAP